MELPTYFTSIFDPCGMRDKSAQLIINCLSKNKKFMSANNKYRCAIIIGIERGILNFSVDFIVNRNQVPSWALTNFVNEYNRKVYIICSIIDKMKDGSFLENAIINRNISWDNLAYVHATELDPDHFMNIRQYLNVRNNAHVQYNFIEGVVPCRCGSKMYRECSIQTRSLDEPANYYRICGGCGNTL